MKKKGQIPTSAESPGQHFEGFSEQGDDTNPTLSDASVLEDVMARTVEGCRIKSRGTIGFRSAPDYISPHSPEFNRKLELKYNNAIDTQRRFGFLRPNHYAPNLGQVSETFNSEMVSYAEHNFVGGYELILIPEGITFNAMVESVIKYKKRWFEEKRIDHSPGTYKNLFEFDGDLGYAKWQAYLVESIPKRTSEPYYADLHKQTKTFRSDRSTRLSICKVGGTNCFKELQLFMLRLNNNVLGETERVILDELTLNYEYSRRQTNLSTIALVTHRQQTLDFDFPFINARSYIDAATFRRSVGGDIPQ